MSRSVREAEDCAPAGLVAGEWLAAAGPPELQAPSASAQSAPHRITDGAK